MTKKWSRLIGAGDTRRLLEAWDENDGVVRVYVMEFRRVEDAPVFEAASARDADVGAALDAAEQWARAHTWMVE